MLNAAQNIKSIDYGFSRGEVFSADKSKRNSNKDAFYY